MRCCPPGKAAVTSSNEQKTAKGSWGKKHICASVTPILRPHHDTVEAGKGAGSFSLPTFLLKQKEGLWFQLA